MIHAIRLCERCGGTAVEPEGRWTGQAYDSKPGGVCTGCGGSGRLGETMIDETKILSAEEVESIASSGELLNCSYDLFELCQSHELLREQLTKMERAFLTDRQRQRRRGKP